MTRGHLCGASSVFMYARSSSAAVSAPSRSTTYATTIWPRSSSARPTTAASATEGWCSRASSISGPAML